MFVLYNRANRARQIARDLNVLRYYPYEGRLVTPQNSKTMTHVVNWGCVRLRFDYYSVLNADLRIAASKVVAYAALEHAGIAHPYMFADAEAAMTCGQPFLGRRDGLSGGRGIVVYQEGQKPASHDFYTQLIACRREYRLHVFNDHIIAIQKKLIADARSIIHNHDNGVTFQHIPDQAFNIGTNTTREIKDMAINAVRAVNLDFGAVDFIQEQGTNKLYVLEVNTAPGIRTDSIYNAYLAAFRLYVEGS